MAEVKVVDVRQMQSRGHRMPQKTIDAYRASVRGIPEKEGNRRQAAKKEPKAAVTIAAAPKPVRKKKVAAYCRVSTLLDSQEMSIDSQREHYTEEILKNADWELAGIYLEAGVSGTKAEVRPELQRLIADCKAGKVEMILTKSISRFARNTQDCLEMVRTLTSLGVNIRFQKEQIDTAKMTSEFMLSVYACFAENESHSISGNMKWAIRKRFENGTYKQSIPPYGYEWKDGVLTIIPEQAEVVREIFRMALSGTGGNLIAQELNERNIPPAKGKRWNQTTIRQMLKNKTYIGDVLYQKTYMDERFRQRTNRGELDQFYEEDHHEAIISREDFENAQMALSQRAKDVGYTEDGENNRGSRRYCFTGILKCKACGAVMHRQGTNNGSIKWICHKHSTHAELCSMLPQDDDDLKAAFINCMNKLAWAQQSRDADCRVLDVYETMLGKTEAERSAERLAEIDALLKENEKETRKLTAIVMRDHFLPEHREKKAFLTTQARELITEKNRILISSAPTGTLKQLKSFISRWKITGDLTAFPEDSFTAFVESCEVNSQKMVTFIFHCGLRLTESLYRTEVDR